MKNKNKEKLNKSNKKQKVEFDEKGIDSLDNEYNSLNELWYLIFLFKGRKQKMIFILKLVFK
jgi:hypothetical protein